MTIIFPPPSPVYNEAFDAAGNPRPHWERFFAALERNADKIPFYGAQTERLMQADLLSFEEKRVRDIIPVILPASDFDAIARGLEQRARLFNALLTDLYGKQSLILNGVLPPDAVFGNPAYFPALKGFVPAGGVFVQEYSAELERSPDGRFWVVNDYLQVPQGVGRTIKNRQVFSRVMPEIYAALSPARVSEFFDAYRAHLFAFAPADKIPTAVLLTESTRKALSFEESYFARNLGISAVEPDDLTVRDGEVYLKNIDGLKKTDIILRRMNDALCDPLELAGFSAFGVAGLTEAARAGNTVVLNPLGTGLAESPVFKAFIHGISRALLGEELLLPSVAAWWGGQEKEARYLIEHRTSLSFRDAFDGSVCAPTAAEIAESPERFVGMEKVAASETPVWRNDRLENARLRLKIPVVYDSGDYRVMPGGLAFTRVGECVGVADLCVVGKETARRPKETAEKASVPVRSTFELTSRIAENMFWLGRNLERSEQLARLLRVTLSRATQGSEFPDPNDVATLLCVFASQGYMPFAAFTDDAERARALPVLKKIMCAADGNTLRTLFRRMKEMADQLHDRLSVDTGELFAALEPLLPEETANDPIILNRLDNVILRQNALSGLIREDMTRDHGWRFMEIGRRLERGLQILNLIGGIVCCRIDGFEPSLESLLETSDSRMTYRVRYMALPTVPLVFDLLVCDRSNPRALIYQILKLRQNISVLENESRMPGLFSKETGVLEDAVKAVDAIDVTNIADLGGTIDDLRARLQNFAEVLNISCFIHGKSTRQGPAYKKGNNG